MAQQHHQSFFEYNITRPYPFVWFTPVALIGCLVLTAVLSLINYVLYGVSLVTQSSTNLNLTIAENQWFGSWPSYFTSNSKPSCEAVNVPVNTMFFTNQTALTYALTDVWKISDTDFANPVAAPSLTYSNNFLENCTVSSIEINVAALDRTAGQIAYAEWGAVIRSFMSCTVFAADGITYFNLTQEYDYVPDSIPITRLSQFLGTNFISRNNITRASLWWGESLMSTYYVYLTWQMQLIRIADNDQGNPAIRQGTLIFTRNDLWSTNDMLDPDFFSVDYRFIVDTMDPPGSFRVIYPGTHGTNRTNGYQVSHLNATQAYPNVWSIADALAKSTYSTILTNLGQTTATPNILTDEASLEYFTAPFTNGCCYANAWPGPATKAYDLLKAATGPLGVTRSSISAKYICQIPQRKSAGTLVITIIVADLVFLQALWKLFKLMVDYLFLKKFEAQDCEDGDGDDDEGGVKAALRRQSSLPKGVQGAQTYLEMLELL